MERQRLIRLVSDIGVGLAAATLVKALGLRHGTVAAVVVGAIAHEALDAPVAAALERAM